MSKRMEADWEGKRSELLSLSRLYHVPSWINGLVIGPRGGSGCRVAGVKRANEKKRRSGGGQVEEGGAKEKQSQVIRAWEAAEAGFN